MVAATRLAVRVALWQVAVVAIVVGVSGRPGGFVLGGALLAVTAVRVRGRWLDEWVGAYLRFRRRRSRRRARPPAGPLDDVAPRLEVRTHTDRSGTVVGLVTDGTSWTVVLRVEPPPSSFPDLLDRLAGTLDHPDVRVAEVQLVSWAVPTPDGEGAWRVYWVAVRFAPGSDPAAVAARGGGETGAVRATAVAALRLATSLRQAGGTVRVLGGEELRAEVSTSLGAEPGSAVRERWWAWSAGPLHHACYALRRPPRLPSAVAGMLGWRARPPALTTCVSLGFARTGRAARVRTRVLLRVAVPADAGGPAVRAALRRAVGGVRGRLVPMDGAHALGVRATVPLARSWS
jgi:type VII secretion protein EccE